MAKLPATAETSIAITVLVMNLEQRLRAWALFWWRFLSGWRGTVIILGGLAGNQLIHGRSL
jgi:hypothetical protein